MIQIRLILRSVKNTKISHLAGAKLLIFLLINEIVHSTF